MKNSYTSHQFNNYQEEEHMNLLSKKLRKKLINISFQYTKGLIYIIIFAFIAKKYIKEAS